MLHNGDLVNAERFRRWLSLTVSCSMCGSGPEDGLHMLRDCPDAKYVWLGLLKYNRVEAFLTVR